MIFITKDDEVSKEKTKNYYDMAGSRSSGKNDKQKNLVQDEVITLRE